MVWTRDSRSPGEIGSWRNPAVLPWSTLYLSNNDRSRLETAHWGPPHKLQIIPIDLFSPGPAKLTRPEQLEAGTYLGDVSLCSNADDLP